MKKILLIGLLLVLLAAAVAGWIFLGPGTGFSAQKEYLYIRSDAATKQAVLDSIEKNKLVSNKTAFEFLASRLNYWTAIKPGKYEIKKGTSLLTIARMLRNGRQTPVNLVITKLRTKEDFARFTGARFEFDSSQMISFLNNSDTLQRYGADTASALWNVIPDTYTYFWNTTPSAVYRKIHAEAKKFWNQDRKTKAEAIGLTPKEAYILASIIEEETTNNKEKDTVASVYLNRLKKGMPLQADPTLKFATREFALKRIAGPILHVASPYNTYQNKGLPPGPICTPSKITIDAVLNPAQTPYLYFVANSRLNGHLFSSTFEEHVKKANVYREEDKKRIEAAQAR
ncbi:endolytic transglycosylase MltG [Flavisolibacter nicotianae]|uniref:endolytic transglycosylase MltG n=1 Tax=Flavisolibacter nicotianae TaxID=2364882 RepID=UPI0013C46137|nr:endolytic transglycosylase MltG [Flavisolibacter nicotianae]